MGGDTGKSSRKPRADSIRNREKLLQSARGVFSAGGPEASLEAVARTAGVGIGTLYRHFPTRDALFQAVYSREVDEMVELARTLGETPDPVDGLRCWLHSAVRMVATKRGMLTALAPAKTGAEEFYAGTSARLRSAVSDLMARGVDAGRLRDDVTPAEVLHAFLGICYASDAPGWQETAARLLDVFVDGLVAGESVSG